MSGSANGQVLDHYLSTQFEVIRIVHDNLDSIQAVASHLTPVEDLVDFREEVAALYAKLGVLTTASELILSATPSGIAVLTAANAAAQRTLLELKSAALQEASYFATAAGLTAANTAITTLNTQMTAVLADLLTKATKVELAAVGLRVDQLEPRFAAIELNVSTHATRVATIEGQITGQVAKDVLIDSQLASVTNLVTGHGTAINGLTTRATANEAGAAIVVTRVTTLETELTNVKTGQTASTTAVQNLTTQTNALSGNITSQGLLITGLTSRLTDVENDDDAAALAAQNLTTTVTQQGALLSSNTAATTQLASRVTTAETGLTNNATGLSSLTTEVTALEGTLTIASEDIVALKAEVSSPGNLAPNAGFEGDTHGWSIFNRGLGWGTTQLDRNLDAATMLPLSTNALSLTQAGQPTGQLGIKSSNLPVTGTQRYILSGWLGAQDCAATLEWRLLDQAGQIIQFGSIGSATPPSLDINQWPRLWGAIPAASAARELQIQVWINTASFIAPTVGAPATAAIGGVLPAATQYFYVVTALTATSESDKSNEVAITTAAALTTPVNAAFSTAATGGTLVAGTYSYRVAAKNAVGKTLASTATTIVTSGATSTVTVNWGAVAGATGYDIYGRAGGVELLIASVGAVTTYTDTGSITPAGALPASNTTATATNANTLSWPAVPGATGYRVYRGTTTGAQNAYYAVGAVTSFVDTGAPTTIIGVPTTPVAKLWLLKPMLEEVSGLQDGPSAWVPGVSGLAKNTAEAVSTLTARIDGVEGDLTATASEVTGLEVNIGTLQSALVNEIVTSANKNAANSASVNTLTSRMTSVETNSNAATTAVNSLTTRVTAVEGVNTSQASSLTSLQSQVNAMDTSTGGQGAAISALDTRVTSAEGTITSQGNAITSLQNSVTSANKIFVQAAPPATAGRTEGDLWIDIDDGNKPYTLTGGQWVARMDGNKNTIFVQGTAPTAKAVNDLWIHTGDSNKPFRWNGTAWVDVSDARTTTNASAITSLSTRVTSVEGVNTSQASAITALESSVNNPSTGVAASATAVSSLGTRVTTAEGNISSTSSAVTAVTSRVTTAEGNINSQASATTALTTRVSTTEGKTATLEAKWNVTLDVNGYISGLTSVNNGIKADFTILADNFKIIAPGHAGRTLFAVNGGGNTAIANDIYLGNGRIVIDTGTHMKVQGIGFGTTNQFVEWYGPKMAINLCSEVNAIQYLKTNGSAYFGGSLSAGVFKNAATSSQVSNLAYVSTGVFGTNGGAKTVVCSLTYSNGGTLTGNQVSTYNNVINRSTVTLQRRYAGGAWVTIGTLSAVGTTTASYDLEMNQTSVDTPLSGSITVTDNQVGTGTFEYQATCSAPAGYFTSAFASGGANPYGYQNLTIVSTEG